MPTVTVIIPTYNHQDYVLKTLESVWNQSFQDYEIIVINDGSPDRTEELLTPFARQGRLKYFQQRNSGQATARNRGLSEASGEFIAFLDDDDLWPKKKLETQVAYLQSHPEIGAVAGTCMVFDEKTREKYFAGEPRRLSFEACFRACPIKSPGQALIRADLLRSIGGFKEEIWGADDYDLWIRLSRSAGIEILPEVALHYRLHASNASGNVRKMLSNSLRVIDSNLQLAPPDVRRNLRAASSLWVYRRLGRLLLRSSKQNFTRGRLRDGVMDIYPVLGFAPQMVRDRKLATEFLRDALPKRILAVRRRLLN